MSRSTARTLHLLFLWLSVTAAAWPAFVLAGTALGLHAGEARQIDAWTLEPKGLLLAHFLEGWRASLPFTAAVGAVAVIDYLLLSRYRVTWIVGGILLPAAGAAAAFALYRDPAVALPTLVATGVLLAVLYRAFEWLLQSFAEGR